MQEQLIARAKYRRALKSSIAIAVLTVAVRSLLHPPTAINSVESWIRSDFILDIPRAICAGLSILAAIHFTDVRSLLRMPCRADTRALFVLLFLSVARFVYGLGGDRFPLSETMLPVLILGNILVAFSEELLFRGLLFQSLIGLGGEVLAISVGSIAFTLFHFGSQPFLVWPSIFIFGVQNSILRSRGVGLAALMLNHFAYDTIIFYFGGTPNEFGLSYLLFLGINLSLCFFIYYTFRENPNRNWSPLE